MTQNAEEFNNILNEINAKVDYIATNNDRQALGEVLNQLQSLEKAFNDNVLNFNFEKEAVFENIQKEITSVIKKSTILKELFPQEEADKLAQLENTFNAKLTEVQNSISETVKQDFNSIAQGIGALYAKVEAVQKNAGENSNLDFIRDDINSLWNKMMDVRTELKISAAENLTAILENINKNDSNLNDMREQLDTLINSLKDKIQNSNVEISEFKDNIAQNLSGYLASIKELFVNFSDEMQAHQDNLSSEIFDKKIHELDILSKDINKLEETVQEKEENYKEILNEKIEGLKDYLKTLENEITSSNINLGNSFAEITEIKNYIANTAIKLDDIHANLSADFNAGSSKIDELKDIVSNRFSSVDSKLYTLEDNLIKEVGGKVSLMEQLKDDIGTSVNTNFNEIKTILECMRANTSQNSTNIVEKFETANENFADNFADITLKIDKLNEQNSSDTENILQKVTEACDKTVITGVETRDFADKKFEELQNYLSNLENILSTTTVNLDGSLNEITEIKEYIANTSLKLDDINLNIANSIGANSSGIEEIKNFISGRLEVINSKLFTMEDNLAKEISGKISEFEQTKDNGSETVNNNLNELKTIVECLRANVQQGASGITDKINNFESIFTEKIYEISAKSEEQKLNSDEIKSLINSLTEQINTNYANHSNNLQSNNAIRDDIAAKIEDLKEHISAIKLATADLNTETKDKLTEKLFAIESKLYDSAEIYEQNLSNLHEKLGEYIKNVELISEETNSKLENSAAEFVDIKTNLNEIQNKISFLNTDRKSFLEESLSSVINKISEVTKDLNSYREEIKTDIREVVRENITFVDKGLQYITTGLDEIKTKQNDTADEITNIVAGNIADIKQEIELLQTDISDTYNSKSEALIKEFEPLKSAIMDFTSYDFDEIIREVKNQIEISYLNLLQELNKNLIENHDTYINIENTYKDVVAKCASLQECLTDFSSNNLELINSTIAGLDLNVRSNLEKNDNFLQEWKTYSEKLDKKLTENNSNIEHSLLNILEELQKTFVEKTNSGTAELKDFLAVMLNNEDLMLTLENINGELADQIQEVKASIANNNGKIEASLANINTDVNKQLNEIKLELSAKSDDEEQVAKLAGLFKVSLDELKSTLLEQINSSLKEVSEITGTLDKHGQTDEKISQMLENLNSKVDILAMEDDTEILENISNISDSLTKNTENGHKISQMLESLNSKVDILAMEDNTEILENISNISDSLTKNTENGQKISEMLESLNSKVDILAMEDDTEILENISDITDTLSKASETDNKISELLETLHNKVDILATADDSELRTEISDVKELILEQRKCFEALDNDSKAQEIENRLNNLLSEINKIDLEKNAQDIKESVMSAIISVTDQSSFVEETEEIKDFVEEKTNAINETLLDVKKQLNNIASSNSDMDFYSYTLQDVESDLAKLRLAINEMSTSNSTNEVGVISRNINRIAKSIEDLRSSLTKEQSEEMFGDFEKLNEDILSISARTNKLLLNSDESYRIINDSMDTFNRKTESLQQQLDAINSKNLDIKLAQIDQKVNATMSSSKILENVMVYLGEWMDGTSELINSIYDKSSKTASIEKALEELKENLPQKHEIINLLEEKFEEQQTRIDRLEKKLEKAITMLEEREADTTLEKIDKIEKQLSKLSGNIEKLTSYVDE